jgi:hypothetical protein
MLAGLSTRRYRAGLEPVGTAIEAQARGTSRSVVSRRFLAPTAECPPELFARPLGRQRFLRLDASDGLLLASGGGTTLGAAVRPIIGDQALVQCWCRHTERNLVEHPPEAEWPLVLRPLRTAWAEPAPAQAKVALRAITRGIADQRPGAAASLREGLADTLRMNPLGVTGMLRRMLRTTNPVESMIEIVRDHARRVKHPESGEMALRWAAAGMLAAEAQFHRVKGSGG